MKRYNVPVVVAINKFTQDTDAELAKIVELCEQDDTKAIVADVWAKGGEGATELAKAVIGVVKFLSSLVTGAYYESRYNQKNSGLKSKINSFGNYLDKEVKNFDEKIKSVIVRKRLLYQ